MITVTAATPVPAGLVAVIVVSFTTVKLWAARGAKVDRCRPGESGAGDRHRRAAGRRTAGGAQAGDRGCGRRGEGELIGG